MALKNLNKRHREVIEHLVAGRGTIDEIANSVKVSRRAIFYWMQDELFKKELEEREADFRRVQKARISQLASKALDTQEQIMDASDNDKARADVASDVLDRAGYVKPKKSENDSGDKRTGGVVILPDTIDEVE
ncbi:MAG: hypothetical protein IJC09_06165 [Clostridia bacterium]|nr:hypothetical protein [Clostridia bacterium]